MLQRLRSWLFQLRPKSIKLRPRSTASRSILASAATFIIRCSRNRLDRISSAPRLRDKAIHREGSSLLGMANRPPPGGSSSARNDLLLDLDGEQPYYSQGQRSTLNDDDLMKAYSYDQDGGQQPRPSVSYDDFIGADRPTHPSVKAERGPSNAGARPQAPYSSGLNRQYSQTSELGNYQRYADDFDDYPEEGQSYYQAGGSTPGRQGNVRREGAGCWVGPGTCWGWEEATRRWTSL